jgi:hypothetical protein
MQRQYLFCQWFESICMVHNCFPSVQWECREMATVRNFRCGNGQAVRIGIDGSLSLDSCRSERMPITAEMGHWTKPLAR